MNTNDEMTIVTEVGVFGNLNIDDPTIKKVKKKHDNDELDAVISEAIKNNANISI